MLFIGYAVSQVLELFLGICFLYHIYPELRYKGKFFKILLCMVSLLLCYMVTWNAWDSFISNSSIILNGIIVSACYCIFFKAEYATVIVWEIFYASSMAFVKMPYMVILGIIADKTLFQVNRGARNWSDLLYCILADCVFGAFAKKSGRAWRLLESLTIRHKKLLMLMDIMLWCLLSYNMWLGKQGFHTADLVLVLIFIVSCMFFIQYLVLRVAYQELKSENNTLDAVQNVLQKQNYALQELYNQNAQRMHDLKHHLIYLMDCFEHEKIKEGREFLAKYMEMLYMTGHKVWTGFTFLDFMLDYKKKEMDAKKIILELEVALYEYPIEEAELGVVLGNLLDNAIEAASACEEGKRYIFLKLSTVNEMFFLSLRNTSSRRPEMKDGKFQTTKNDTGLHGFGVENVKHIIKKYDGIIDFKYGNGYFEVNILV